LKQNEFVNKILQGHSVDTVIDRMARLAPKPAITESIEEQSLIKPPQKTYKPIDRLSKGMRIIKKLHQKGIL